MMSVLKQFNFTRTSLLTLMQELNEKVADQESKHFENTIRWHIGNILLFDEKLIFLSREKSHKIPKEYAELFSSDIKVKDWSIDRKSTRLNSSHVAISYVVFCLEKKTQETIGYLIYTH